jgi:tRNA (guanine-N7-)-methyltransferase
VNPLSSTYQQPVKLAGDWVRIVNPHAIPSRIDYCPVEAFPPLLKNSTKARQLFADPTLPFHVDIGCARGGFCISLARSSGRVNVLGLEIRKSVASFCAQKARESGLPNVGFLSCNANVDLAVVLKDISALSRVDRVSVQVRNKLIKPQS